MYATYIWGRDKKGYTSTRDIQGLSRYNKHLITAVQTGSGVCLPLLGYWSSLRDNQPAYYGSGSLAWRTGCHAASSSENKVTVKQSNSVVSTIMKAKVWFLWGKLHDTVCFWRVRTISPMFQQSAVLLHENLGNEQGNLPLWVNYTIAPWCAPRMHCPYWGLTAAHTWKT